MSVDNLLWGAPHIHGELLKLGFADVNGVVLLADPTVIERGRRIAELAQAARLPTAFQRRECRMERT